MFPSRGYFSKISCVFYVNRGCRRTYCHYRHKTPSPENNQSTVSSSSTYDSTSTPTKLLIGAPSDSSVNSDPDTQYVENYKPTYSSADVDDMDFESGVLDYGVFDEFRLPVKSYEPTQLQELKSSNLNRITHSSEKPLYSVNTGIEFSPYSVSNTFKSSQSLTHTREQASNIASASMGAGVNDVSETQIAPESRSSCPENFMENEADVDIIKGETSNLNQPKFSPDARSIGKYAEDHDTQLSEAVQRQNKRVSLSLRNHKPKNKQPMKNGEDMKDNKNCDSQGPYDSFLIGNEVTEKAQTVNINLKITPTADPFSRWMKNKKIRKILGNTSVPSRSGVKLSVENICQNEVKISPDEPTLPHSGDEEPIPAIGKRVAHQPKKVQLAPVIINNIKIPIGFRQFYCEKLFDEFQKVMDVEEAQSKALEEEKKISTSSKSIILYKTNCTRVLLKYRRQKEEKSTNTVSKLTPTSRPEFTFGWTLYECLELYLLTEDQLQENGYPLASPDHPGNVTISMAPRKTPKNKISARICDNCHREYDVDDVGMPTTRDDCFFHWGRLRNVNFKGETIKKFTCCGGFNDAVPCDSRSFHVSSGAETCMTGFLPTPELPSNLDDSEAGIYALDCEMCYTTDGIELARLTVVDVNEDVVFDEMVTLKNPVLDYCTRFSGITEDKIKGAKFSFDDVQRWVLDHFYSKTILIGHSLENDLKALKITHTTVVDTSVTYPHRFGPPNKMSLKHLALTVLQRNIQENDGGHDSKEDAIACLQLMMVKIREDSKRRKPRSIISHS